MTEHESAAALLIDEMVVLLKRRPDAWQQCPIDAHERAAMLTEVAARVKSAAVAELLVRFAGEIRSGQ